MAAGRNDPTAFGDPHVINLVALLIAQVTLTIPGLALA